MRLPAETPAEKANTLEICTSTLVFRIASTATPNNLTPEQNNLRTPILHNEAKILSRILCSKNLKTTLTKRKIIYHLEAKTSLTTDKHRNTNEDRAVEMNNLQRASLGERPSIAAPTKGANFDEGVEG